MRHLRRHANALGQRRVRVNCFADVHGVCTHFNSRRNLTDHAARMRADHAAAQDLAVAVRLWAVIKQQFGKAVRPARRRSLKPANWSLVVTLLVLSYKMLPYIEST